MVKSKSSRTKKVTRMSESLRRQVFDSIARVVDRRCYAPVRSDRLARLVLTKICALPLLLRREKDRQNSQTKLMKRSLRDYAYTAAYVLPFFRNISRISWWLIMKKTVNMWITKADTMSCQIVIGHQSIESNKFCYILTRRVIIIT